MRRLVEKRNNLNAAVVIYSNKAFVKLNFSQGFSLQNFNFVIDMLPYLGGKRTVRSPTDSTVDQLFRPVFIGPRTHLPKVAIQLMYFTDRGVIATPFITFKDRRISTVQLYAAFFYPPDYETTLALKAIGKYQILNKNFFNYLEDLLM